MAVAERIIKEGPIQVWPFNTPEESELPSKLQIPTNDDGQFDLREKGRLVARLIAVGRDKNEQAGIQRDEILKTAFSFYGGERISRHLTRFIAQLRSREALVNRKPFIQRLLPRL